MNLLFFWIMKVDGEPSLWRNLQYFSPQKQSGMCSCFITPSPPPHLLKLFPSSVSTSSCHVGFPVMNEVPAAGGGSLALGATSRGFVHNFPVKRSSGRTQEAGVDPSDAQQITVSRLKEDFNIVRKMQNSWRSFTFTDRTFAIKIHILEFSCSWDTLRWTITFDNSETLHKTKILSGLFCFVPWSPQIIHITCTTTRFQLTPKLSVKAHIPEG